MRINFTNRQCNLILLLLLPALSAFAQNAQVTVGKHANRIPKSCESVVPASIEGDIDIPALVKEAYCKGDGDMIAEYSYVMNSKGRSIDKKGQAREGSTTYEVFIPTLKSGTGGKGVLVVTARDGVPVPAAELEKARTEAAERLEKAEEKNARERPSSPRTDPSVKGMLPLGMYTRTTNSWSSVFKSGSAALAIHTFLKTCDLTLLRREQHDGRETMVFKFTPRANAQFNDNEKYIAQLTGEIWIDAQDRIVTRLAGWPPPVAAIPIPASTNRPKASRKKPQASGPLELGASAPTIPPPSSSLTPDEKLTTVQSPAPSEKPPAIPPAPSGETSPVVPPTASDESPPAVSATASGERSPVVPPTASGERPPAVYVEMMRLPEGFWLPREIRINGADYQKLFDNITTESVSIFSNYIRFSTDIKDVKLDPPSNP